MHDGVLLIDVCVVFSLADANVDHMFGFSNLSITCFGLNVRSVVQLLVWARLLPHLIRTVPGGAGTMPDLGSTVPGSGPWASCVKAT